MRPQNGRGEGRKREPARVRLAVGDVATKEIVTKFHHPTQASLSRPAQNEKPAYSTSVQVQP